MKFEKIRKWIKRIIVSMIFLIALMTGFLSYTFIRTERTLDQINALILRGDFVSAEELIVREENFLLFKAKNKFARFRDGRIKLGHCRVAYGLTQFDVASDVCLAVVSELKTVDEKFLAYYYAALAKFNRGLSVSAGAGAATDAIHYLKEALKMKEDGETQALLAALLKEEAKFKEMLKAPKDKSQQPKDKPRVPSLFRDEGGNEAGTKEKGY